MDSKDEKQNSNRISPLFYDKEFNHFLNCGHLAIIYINREGILQYVTPLVSSITGYTIMSCGKFIKDTPFALQNPEFVNKIQEFSMFIQNKETLAENRKWINIENYHMELELIGNNRITYQMVIHACASEHNKVSGFMIVFYDITTRKSFEKVLEAEKEKYRLIAELTDSALWEYDIDKKVFRQYRKLRGKNSDHPMVIRDFRNTSIHNGWIYPEDIPVFEAYCDSMDQGNDDIQFEFRGLGDCNEFIWLRYQGTAVRNSEGRVHIIIGRTVNIDREFKDREKLIQKTERDALTGLYNRAATKEKAEQCLAAKENEKKSHSFMIIDIDNFKKANDQWGHLFGDILLETFAKKLELVMASTDIIGRIGGDEFVILQKGVQTNKEIENAATEICNIARNHLNVIKDNSEITVSIGIAQYPKDGNNYDLLYQKADKALYHAKAKGKDQYAFYSPDLEVQQVGELDASNWLPVKLIDMNSSEIEKRLLNFAFDIVNESNDPDYAINHILSEIGNFYELSRITLFDNGIGSPEAHIAYEWLNHGIASIIEYPVKDTFPLLLNYEEKFSQYGLFYFNDINELDIAPEVMSFYRILGLKAMVQCAIFDDNRFLGTISYEDCVGVRKWSKSEFDTLYTLTKLIGSYIIQLKSKKELNIEVFFTQETLNNQKLSNYAIAENSYELLYFSKYTKTLYPDAKLGELCYKAIYHKDAPCDDCPINGLNENNTAYCVDNYNEEKEAWFSTTASAITMPDGKKINLICSCDVTGFIERVNSKDPLTGLLTMTKFEVDAMKMISAAVETNYLVLYCDFDKFKNVNAEWGYSTGNTLLVLFADTVRKFIKDTELFCRIPSDKFIMLLSYQNKKSALDRIKLVYSRVQDEFNSWYPNLNIVITGGVYFLSPEDKNITLAIDKADTARKTIKGIHKSTLKIYDEALHYQITKEKLIASKMHHALKNQEFVVYMQPKVDIKTLKIIGAEALVRWKLPTGECLSPMEFIPIFEKNGFIDELDFYVYEKTMFALRQWIDLGKKDLVISLNVSRSHLKDPKFMERLERLLDKYQIPARLIELEITESMFYVEQQQIEYILNNLRKRGFLISIDDFGSGYSSLNMLKTLPVDILKLDREFFMKNEMGHADKIVISGIISLAKGLGLQVISEGVETEEQLEFLKDSSCDMVQGYLFYKPIPMSEFVRLIE